MDYNGYYHEHFLRYRPHLLAFIRRTKTKGTGVRGKTDPASEPDFYRMPFVTPMIATTSASDDSVSSCLHKDSDQTHRRNRPVAAASPSGPNLEPRPGFGGDAHPLPDLDTQKCTARPDQNRIRSMIPIVSRGNLGVSTAAPHENSMRDFALSLKRNAKFSVLSPEPGNSARQLDEASCFHRDVNLEPTPLPPAYDRQGDGMLDSTEMVCIANHPCFEQIDFNTFSFAET
jgi:hypothetical protein